MQCGMPIMIRPFLLAVSVGGLLSACAQYPLADAPAQARAATATIAPLLTDDARDPQSYAQPAIARVTHVDLKLDLDFDHRRIVGQATLDIAAQQDADEIILDSRGLDIAAITDSKGRKLAYTIGAENGEIPDGNGEIKGAPLAVKMGANRQIIVNYSAANAEALQWLSPEQTAGKTHPYLFSQGQATLNRTWIPTQDSPGIRQTWHALITAPHELTVVMSGLQDAAPKTLSDGRRQFSFGMDKPVAPYLIAIAAGNIVFKELGPRTGVWSEPVMIEAAAKELEDTEAMVAAAEKLYGPYRWGRYDMIVLPPSFPYGGMENPVMTFLTPTFIAGDKSLTGLVAHELAHSWSGNLVTNANWTDSWLNEGVTSYFENRIVEEIYGKKRAVQEALLDFAEIEKTLAEVGNDAPGTALHLPFGTDGAGSAIVYNKGAAFLRTLENAVGRTRFDAWLRQWFDNHAFQPATSAMILADMEAHLVKNADEASALRLREWIYKPGLPANAYRPDPSAFAEVDEVAARYTSARDINVAAWRGWTSAERQRFLSTLPRVLKPEELEELDRKLGLSGNGNVEEKFLWLRLALENRYQPIVTVAQQFLNDVGRTKFVRPLYATLMAQGEWGAAIARATYANARAKYHGVTQGAIDKIVAQKQ